MTKQRALLATAAMIGTSYAAAAAQTAQTEAGDVVENTFTLDYSVGGTAQPGITNDPTPPTGYASNGDGATTFTVDRKVDLTVTSIGDTSGVTPGSTDVPLFFSVGNLGNDDFQYRVAATNRADSNANEDFDASSFEYAATVVATAAECSATTTGFVSFGGTNGANGTDVPAGQFLCVRVRSDVPNALSNGNRGGVFLTATAVEPTDWVNDGALGGSASEGSALTAATTNAIGSDAQNVFLDPAFADAGDAAGNAAHAARGTIIVSSAALDAEKTVAVFSTDGTGCATIPGSAPSGAQFAAPGACVSYAITVINDGDAQADAIAISDELPAGLAYAAATATGFGGGATVTPSAGCTSSPLGTCTVSLSGGALAEKPASGTSSGTLTIRAIVQ